MKYWNLCVVLFFVSLAFAQERPQAVLVDERKDIGCEQLLATVDNFYIQLNNNVDAKGYVVLSGSNDDLLRKIDIELLFDGAVQQRRFDATRVTKIRGKEIGPLNIQFWLVPAGAEIPKFDVVDWNLRLSPDTKRHLLHTDMEQICSTPTFPEMAKELIDDNPDARIHVVIHANSVRTRQKGISEALSRMKKIDKKRVRYFFAPLSDDPFPYADYWIVVPKPK